MDYQLRVEDVLCIIITQRINVCVAVFLLIKSDSRADFTQATAVSILSYFNWGVTEQAKSCIEASLPEM